MPRRKPPSPGSKQRTLESQMLAQELRATLKAHRMTAYALAGAIDVSHSQLYGILQGDGRNMTPVLALKLSRLFDDDPLRWMTLQCRVDLAAAMAAYGDAVRAIVPLKEREQ